MKKSAGMRRGDVGRLALAIALAGLAAGCSALPKAHYADEAPVRLSSPVVADVEEANRHPGPYPRFADIPKLPTDVRTPAQWNRAVKAVKADRAALERDTAELAARQPDTAAFAAQARQADTTPGLVAPTAKEQAASAAYAKALRNRVKPPPKGQH